MKLINNIGLILLAVYLILVAVTALMPGVAIPSIIVGIIALAAAIFILLGKQTKRLNPPSIESGLITQIPFGIWVFYC